MTLTHAQWVRRDLSTNVPARMGSRAIRWGKIAASLLFWAATTYAIWATVSYSFRMQATATVLEESLIKMHGACLMLRDAPAQKFEIKQAWR